MNKNPLTTLSYHPSSSLNKTIHTTQRKFSDSIELNIQRGLNIINIRSGQHVAAWIYDGYEFLSLSLRFWNNEPGEKMLSGPEDAAKMQDGDTIWVSYTKLEEFTRDFLPYINTTFALITTYDGMTRRPKSIELLAPGITAQVYLLGWFATNIGRYTGGYQFHPNVFPFPLGLKSNFGSKKFQNPLGTTASCSLNYGMRLIITRQSFRQCIKQQTYLLDK